MKTGNQERDTRVEIPRSALHGDLRFRDRNPPLVRGNISERINEELIEIPVPVTRSVDRQEVRVLHVDDEPEINDLTKTFLERIDEDFSVAQATSVVEALDRLERGAFDCIISDYDMPNTNGIEFLEIVREMYPDLPFILFTGKGSEEVASEAIAAGVTDYMQKEIGTDQYEVLANRVRNAVDRYRTRERFWQALSWYRRLVEQDLAGVFLIQNEEFIYVNERFSNIFGYAQSELVGESPLVIAADEAAEATLEKLLEIDHEEIDTFQYEFTGERADDTRIDIEVHGGSIQYEGAPGCIGILWDRTADP